METGQIHHIELYISNLQKSKNFWGWLLTELGYTEYQSWEQGQSWKLGGTYIVLVQTEDTHLDIPYHRKKTGLNHIAFKVRNEQLESFKTQLENKNVEILYKDQNFANKIFFEDPDRIKIELASY